MGFLNGMGISIALGQIGKIFGFAISKEGIVPRLAEFVSKLGLTHPPTLAVGVLAFAVLAISPKVFPRVPAALIVMAATGVAVRVLGLDAAGVQVVGPIPAGLPPFRLPIFPVEHVPTLLAQAAGVALIGFSSMMLTARSFAAKNKYEIDVDREFAALGAADIASALSGGFAVSGADSRTAMSDAAGGRTRMTGLITAGAVAVVLLFFTGPLQYVPIAALGAVLVKAAFGLLDIRSLKTFLRMDWRELAISLLATLGVATVGAVQAILVAVILALLRFVKLVSRPRVEILGKAPGIPGLHSIDRHREATVIEGLLLFRFNAPLVFFNAPFFKRSVMQAVETAGPGLKVFVMDLIPVTMIDLTGLQAATDVIETLQAKGVEFVAAGRQAEWQQWAERRGFQWNYRSFPTLRAAVKHYERSQVETVAESAT